MSRETNSVLLRFGINTFWSNSLNIAGLSTSIFQFHSFIVLILRNYFFKPLKIQYCVNNINLYIFYFKENRFSFLYKFLKLKKVILNSLIFRKIYAIGSKRKQKSIYFIFKLLAILSLVNKISLIKYHSILLKKKLLNKSILYVNLFFKKRKKLKKRFFFLRKYKIKLLNFSLKYKIISLLFILLTAFYMKKEVFFNLKAVLNLPLFFNKVPFFFKYFRDKTIKSKVYLIFLSFTFFKAAILTLYINILILKTKNKKHVKTLIFFFTFLKILFQKQIISVYGLKFKIAGRLGGKLRKACFGYQLGSIKLQTFDILTNYSCDFVFTQFGSFCLKLWLFDLND